MSAEMHVALRLTPMTTDVADIDNYPRRSVALASRLTRRELQGGSGVRPLEPCGSIKLITFVASS